MITTPRRSAIFVCLCLATACAPTDETPTEDASRSADPAMCDVDNGGLTLPAGFCAAVIVNSLPGARHIEVAPNGDVFVALRDRRGSRNGPVIPGGVAVLRPTADGRDYEVVGRFGEVGGNDVVLHEGFLYFAPDDRVVRYPFETGAVEPAGPAETIVAGLPDTRNHTAKSIALSGTDLYVNIGSPSNACMTQSRTAGSAGMDPCPELDTRAGIWHFHANTPGQSQADGSRFATGLRNVVALRMHPEQGVLYGVVHGRDQLHDMWPDRYTVEENAEKPAEEFVRLTEGSDYGWPYCYFDPATGRKLLAPEYGGDGEQVGRCADADMPLIGFPAHWAPNDLEFYTGTQFPARYHGGAFIAFHGSWNRAPLPQEGYRVAFVPADGAGFSTEWQTFADGFQPADPQTGGTASRPVGIATASDGSLLVVDSNRGTIWRILYVGS